MEKLVFLQQLIHFYFENLIVTQSVTLKSELEQKYFKKRKDRQVNNNILIQVDKNRIASIEKFNHKTKIATNISIQKFKKNIMVSRIDAKEMKWENDSWILKDIIYRNFNSNNIFFTLKDSILDININQLSYDNAIVFDIKSFLPEIKNKKIYKL